ncbi:MAG: Zn-ribbon domain-containing protein [Methanosarcinaceae archaeon]|nr:Zn-ribbon domain-containing protein [Methanosarcinaceae archaeon]
MPHKCTRCEHIFEDGDSVILTGCPNCGWNKFLYVKSEDVEASCEETEPKASDIVDETIDTTLPKKIITELDEVLGIKKEESCEEENEEERVESVRILGPGSYELNLDSLLKRKEIIMAIKENGSYAVDLPSVFKKKKKEK